MSKLNTSIARSVRKRERLFMTHYILFTALSLKWLSNALVLVSLVLVQLADQNSQIFYIIDFFGATAPNGPGPPYSRGFYITHNNAPQSVGLLWTSHQLFAHAST